MKNGKILLLLMTAAFVLLAAGIGYMEPAPQPDTEVNIPLSAMVELGGRQERITCWEDPAGEYVVFLPSGAELSRVRVDRLPLEADMDSDSIQLNVPYALAGAEDGTAGEHTLTFLQSSGIPSLYLDVQSGSMDIIHETKGNQESGKARLYSQTGEAVWSGDMESLKGRGNSSWFREKKSYSLTLRREADLLGMGQAKNWILLANAMDPSHLRNKAVYDLAAGAGMAYAPACRWVDLYLNGEYAGLYLLSERNEIHPQRLDLAQTGSFLVSRESAWRLVSQNYPRVLLDSGAALRVHDSGLTEADLYRIWQPAENAILAEDGIDPVSGTSWQDHIDLDSWAMDYLMGEIFGNVDAGSISQYYYRDGADPTGKIYAGPVWDYDLSMGSQNAWQAETVQAFFGDKAHIWSREDTTWFYWLNRKPEFRDRVRTLYREVFRPLVRELLETGLDVYAETLQQSAALDQRRWGTGNAQEETAYIRRYLTERLAFLDSLWLEDREYCRVLVLLDENSSSVCYAVLPGETVPALPDHEETWEILGWYDGATEQPFDSSRPIYEDTVVYLKKVPTEEDRISPFQAAPVMAGLGILLSMILADRKRRSAQREKAGKSIVNRENV